MLRSNLKHAIVRPEPSDANQADQSEEMMLGLFEKESAETFSNFRSLCHSQRCDFQCETIEIKRPGTVARRSNCEPNEFSSLMFHVTEAKLESNSVWWHQFGTNIDFDFAAHFETVKSFREDMGASSPKGCKSLKVWEENELCHRMHGLFKVPRPRHHNCSTFSKQQCKMQKRQRLIDELRWQTQREIQWCERFVGEAD